MTRRTSGGPLEPVLHHVEEELTENLTRVRRVDDVSAESTGELERLADTLGQAAQQARAAAALRRRIRASDMVGRLADRLFEAIAPSHETFLRPRVTDARAIDARAADRHDEPDSH